jgi:caffeoyl-CoA O-methyltransferase
LVRCGGVVAVDNMFMHGSALPGASGDEDGDAIRALAEKIYGDERVEPSLIPIGDGLLLARKR